jgi:indole-3-glycerol phosphate synthase
MILDEIVVAKKKELRRAKEERPPADLRAKAKSAPPLLPFELRGETVSIIAEIKRASPRKVLRPDLDPEKLARQYAEGGAKAISVLTDKEFFRGSVEDLRKARKAGLPVLRKDFVIDEYQLWEARVLLADAALLIVRILEKRQLADYVEIARELGLATLVEAHTEKEVERALDAGARIVGINNRDLDTFRVSIEATARLRPLVPPEVVVVSESGLSKPEDLDLLRHLKVDAALIGEELATAPDPVAKLKDLLHARNPRSH